MPCSPLAFKFIAATLTLWKLVFVSVAAGAAGATPLRAINLPAKQLVFIIFARLLFF